MLHYELHEVEPYVNWLYFFNAWGFPARYGNVAQIHNCTSCRAQWLASFADEEKPKAREAMKLYDEALALLHKLDGQIRTHAIVGLYEANGEGEEIVLKHGQMANGEGRRVKDMRLPLLRQQHGETCLCWADFLPPMETGQTDTVGLFVTSVDEDMVNGKLSNGKYIDDYHFMLAQTLADRLAEATAERMHEEVRKQLWGYAKDEQLTVEEMFQEKYVGRRPAVGYPSLPDQSLNFLIDQLLDMKRIGVSLTESGAMRPHASTSGLIISHPQAQHFAIGHIGEDQLKDYALRRGMPEAEMRRFLATSINS
ncbi:MAG: 5-methyltetrahydrofolate--homocysteine methyltransferase [Bacteroidaceae bacterium]|nr:5-methyltetrahydrofolate--homocysteine methyltransferase [Bacteroidaceae bacterium]